MLEGHLYGICMVVLNYDIITASTLVFPPPVCAPTVTEVWLNLRLRPTFTTSQDALRKGGTDWSLSPAGEEQPGIMSVTGRWPHNIVPSTCSYTTALAPPVLVRLERKCWGQTDPSLALSRGAGWRDRPELRSDFPGRKGEGRGASDKRAAIAFLKCFILSPS